MLKILIQENDAGKIYFATGVEFHQTKKDGFDYNELVLFSKKAKVKSNMFLLHPGDVVSIEEVEE